MDVCYRFSPSKRIYSLNLNFLTRETPHINCHFGRIAYMDAALARLEDATQRLSHLLCKQSRSFTGRSTVQRVESVLKEISAMNAALESRPCASADGYMSMADEEDAIAAAEQSVVRLMVETTCIAHSIYAAAQKSSALTQVEEMAQ
jgi:hypothetical protein